MINAHDAYEKSKDNLNKKMNTIMSVVEEIIVCNCKQGNTSALISEEDIFKNTKFDGNDIMNIVKNILLENGYEADVIDSYHNELAIKVSWDKSDKLYRNSVKV